MKKITKGKILAIILILFLGVASYFIRDKWQEADFQENYGQYVYYVPEYTPNFQYFEGGKALFYNWKLVESEEQRQMENVKSEASPSYTSIRTFGHGYFAIDFMKLKNNPSQNSFDSFNRNVPEKGEYWKLAVYKLQGDKLERKEFDIFRMVRSYDKNLVPSEIEHTGIWLDSVNQQRYVRILLHPKYSEKDEDYRVYFIDLDQGRILSADEVRIQDKDTKNNFVYDTSFHDNLSEKGVTVSTTGAGLNENYSMKNLRQTVLAKSYPELYKIMQGYDPSVAYLTDGTDVQFIKELAELFFPPGTNVFENVKIPANHSVDGQEHVVNSAEELQRYYKEGE